MDKHILFWEEELRTEHAFHTFIRQAEETKFQGYPTSITVECSTYCNAKCRNCTHEELIQSGKRVQKIADLRDIYYRIRKCKLFTLLFHVKVNDVSPNGLGESLIHPNIVQIINYMDVFFPGEVGINTNASLLSGELANQIAQTNMSYIYLSLSYFNKEIYEREIGLDYDKTIDNICNFLKIRSEKNFSGRVIIHIFNNDLNSKEDIEHFKSKFTPLLQKQDVLEIRRYLELVNNDVKTKEKKMKEPKPCYELWQVMTLDIDGNIFPCCMGVWNEYSKYLSIGNISDSIFSIVDQLEDLREKQFDGDFGSCLRCGTLWQNPKFKLPLAYYDKEMSISGKIQYKKSIRGISRLLKVIEERFL